MDKPVAPKKIRVGFLLEMPRSGGGSFQWMINILDALVSYHDIEIFVYYKKNYENLRWKYVDFWER